MMYRSGWGTKPDRKVTLAATLRRPAFDAILAAAVHSTYVADGYGTEAQRRAAVARSGVRVPWDPDHGPTGRPLARRAIQLGPRGQTLARYAADRIVSTEDVSPFVADQRAALSAGGSKSIRVPTERASPVGDPATATRLGTSVTAAAACGRPL